MEHRDLRGELARLDELLSTAAGTAELALEGNREALKGWAALLAAYLLEQANAPDQAALRGFPQGYNEEDVRACLRYAAVAFESVHAMGEEPNLAFGWKRAKRGRPKLTSTNYAEESNASFLVETIEDLVKQKGLTVVAAIRSVANDFGQGEDRLFNLYKSTRGKKVK